jgi:hypothetical protein
MRWPISFAALLCVLIGCGAEVPKGGVKSAVAPADGSGKPPKRLPTEPTDLIPEDLEIVLRIDLSKVRDSLGPDASAQLMKRAVDDAGSSDTMLRSALAVSEVVWLGMRVSDISTGDRVMVLRTMRKRSDDSGDKSKPDDTLKPDEIAWSRSDTDIDGLSRWEAKTRPLRSGTSRIYTFGERDAVFVSPVEVMSVERVLREGPDLERGQPEARGLLSLDYRARALSPELRNQFPSLSMLIAGIVRIKAIVEVTGQRLELDGRINCKTSAAADKVLRFLNTIVSATAERPRYTDLLSELKLEREAGVVHVHWPLPREAVRALLVPAQDVNIDG